MRSSVAYGSIVAVALLFVGVGAWAQTGPVTSGGAPNPPPTGAPVPNPTNPPVTPKGSGVVPLSPVTVPKLKSGATDLFNALAPGVNEAAVSIGQLCNPSECDQLAGRLGKLPFDVVTSGLDQILFRPQAEVSDDAKVKLIGRLRELGTGEANR